MSEPPENVYDSLKRLIDATQRTERQCRKYLHHAANLLFREDVLKEIRCVEPELVSSVGVSDYVISGYIGNHPFHDSCTKAYVWELKAPQCFMFEKDTENRLRPGNDLAEAENQLLYYFDEIRGSDTLRNRFNVSHPQYVCLGGIIIGSRKNLVKGDYEERKKTKLWEDAMRIRREYLYDRASIRLITWSDVLDHVGGKYLAITKQSTAPDYAFEAAKIPSGTISTFESVKP